MAGRGVGPDFVEALARGLARVAVPKIITLRVGIGTRFPAVRTSQGKVLLAALDEAALTAVLAQPSEAGLPPDARDRPLAEVRRELRTGPGPRLGFGG